MKPYKYLFLAASFFFCVIASSCGKDDDVIEDFEHQEDEEVTYYDYSEKGFFMNGEILAKGSFECDSILTGYAKYVKRSAHYTTISGEECEMVLGYGLVVELDNYAKFYSDDITYNADSTNIKCKGEFMILRNSKTYDASIEAKIDSIGKPHLITCHTTADGKKIALQFRQTYYKDPYSELKHPDPDNFEL